MAVDYLHGAETIEADDGFAPIRTVKTAVVAILGIAPIGEINKPIPVASQKAAAQFGPDLAGFTIPKALKASIIDHGAGTAFVVNVLDPAVHKTAVTNEARTFNAATNKVKLAHPVVAAVVVTNVAGTTTYVLNTDYKVNLLTGELERIPTGAIPSGGNVHVDYTWADPSKVLAADIIGEVNEAGERTGLQALLDTFTLFGYDAKIIIAPAFSTQASVRAEMEVIAAKLRAVALVDAPIGTTPEQAITGRGPSGSINFNTSSNRSILCYPYAKSYDRLTDSTVLEPYSQRMAGVMCLNDVERGFWTSPSNREIKGIVGFERAISARINDPEAETNQLNEVGITTYFNQFGSGFRTWGNRTAAWPSVTHPKNFIHAIRTADAIHESVEQASLAFQDRNITNGFITFVVESVNEYIRTLIGREALLDGKCWYDPAENNVDQLALGNVVFCYDFMYPTVAERLTYKSFIELAYLRQLGQQN